MRFPCSFIAVGVLVCLVAGPRPSPGCDAATDSAATLLDRAVLHFSQSRFDQALVDLERATLLKPGDTDIERLLHLTRELTAPAEAYMYGHPLGPVTIEDVATDGKVVTLKGIQFWPRLSPPIDEPIVIVDETMSRRYAEQQGLMDSVRAVARELRGRGEPVGTIRRAMVDLLRVSPLVRDVRDPEDPGAGWFELRWRDDPHDDWGIVSLCHSEEEPPTFAERLASEVRRLQSSISCGELMVITPSGGMWVPRRDADPIRREIQAAIDGTWSGDRLPPDLVEMFRHPLDLDAAKEQYRRLHPDPDDE